MKNILIIVPSLSGGGAERTATLLASKLSLTKEYKVYLSILSDKPIKYKINSNIDYFIVDNNINSRTSINRNIKRIKYISKKVKELRIDIIIGYTIIGGILSCLVKMQTGIKNIVCERQDPNKFPLLFRIARNILYRKATGAVFQTIDAQHYFLGIVENSVVIPNFLITENMPEPHSFSKRSNKIINVGRLEPVKNQAQLIKLFSQIHTDFPDYTLEIYGEGSQYEYLLNLIKIYGIKNKVFLKGFTSHIFDKLNDAKIFLFPSKYEGYPNALLESMAMGLVSIASDCPCGGPRSMIIDEENGILVPVGDEESFKEKLIMCLRNEELMERISNNAINIMDSNSSNKVFEKWILYIDNICSDIYY